MHNMQEAVSTTTGAYHSGCWKARGQTRVDAAGEAQITATENSIVHAAGRSRVTALGKSTVYAQDHTTVEAYESSTIFASGRCQVTIVSWGAVTVHLKDEARVVDLVGHAKILTADS